MSRGVISFGFQFRLAEVSFQVAGLKGGLSRLANRRGDRTNVGKALAEYHLQDEWRVSESPMAKPSGQKAQDTGSLGSTLRINISHL